MGVFDKKESFSSLLKKAYPQQWRATRELVVKPAVAVPKVAGTTSVIVDCDQHLNYYFCPECKPQYGDRIIAKTGKGGIKIHTITCKAMSTIAFDKFMEAHRE